MTHRLTGPAEGLPEVLHLNRSSFKAWGERLRVELATNILPYWATQMVDRRGGFYGGRDNNGMLRDELPRSAVLGARALWTFSTAARLSPHPEWQRCAGHAWAWLHKVLWDPVHAGVYWSVDKYGGPLAEHKHSYAQGFAIYALSARYRLSADPQALAMAKTLFMQLDAATHDAVHGGNVEGCERDWQVRADARLSDKEPPSPKSMNTLLHVMEGYTELLRVWPDPTLALRLRELVELFLERIWLAEPAQFGLFFTTEWQCVGDTPSYGHDIEAGWLLNRAAEVLGDAALQQRTRALGVRVADSVLMRGVHADGSVLAEGAHGDPHHAERHWWCQAEGMVGFWDAFEAEHDPRHAQAAWRCWRYIEQHHIDRVGGDWFKVLDANGRPLARVPKAGPWECPYHHARACFEMIERLARLADGP